MIFFRKLLNNFLNSKNHEILIINRKHDIISQKINFLEKFKQNLKIHYFQLQTSNRVNHLIIKHLFSYG